MTMKITNILWIILVLNSCSNNEGARAINTDLVQSPLTADSSSDEVAMPQIEIDKYVFDFGDIQQNESVNTDFIIRNIGEAPLLIRSAKGSCGCTVPVWPREPIISGEQDTIKVIFNSGSKQGKQNQRVTLVTNAIPSTKVLTIKGNVLAPKNN